MEKLPDEMPMPPPPAEDAPHPADAAAEEFMRLSPLFQQKMEELNNRSLKKVVTALYLYPFEDKQIHWSYTQELELFQLGIKLNDCRFIMKKTVYDMRKEEVEEYMKKDSEESKESVNVE